MDVGSTINIESGRSIPWTQYFGTAGCVTAVSHRTVTPRTISPSSSPRELLWRTSPLVRGYIKRH